MTSDWRGEKRITSAPNRAISNRLEPAAISSIAQQANPMGMGQSEFLRPQLAPSSRFFRSHSVAVARRVTTTSPSTLELYPNSVLVSIGSAKLQGFRFAPG